MHKIVNDKSKRALILSLSGNIDTEQANIMLNDFNKTISVLSPEGYILIISPENISASFLIIPILRSFIKTIARLKFKKIYLINSDKYTEVIKQALSSYGADVNLFYAGSVAEALGGR